MQLLKDIAFSAVLIAMIAIAFLIEYAREVLVIFGLVVFVFLLAWCVNTPCQPTLAPEPVSVPTPHSILEN